MNDELFTIQPTESPRLKWLKEHGVVLNHFPDVAAGDEDDFGNEVFPWIANDRPIAQILIGKADYGVGHTEHEAIVDLAIRRGWRLWSEL